MSAPTVPYKQAASPSPRITANLQGLSANVRYKVDWADAFTFVNSTLGLLDGNPWAWPASPNMRATSANIEPIGHISRGGIGSAPGEYYESAFVDVTFSSIVSTPPMSGEYPPATQFDPSNPIEMSSFQVQYASESIKIPSGALKWAATTATGSAQTIPAGVAKPGNGSDFYRSPCFSLSLTLHNCRYVNASVFANKVGKVNQAAMWGCEPESILFDGVSTSRRDMSNGTGILDVTLIYKWKQTGWNVSLGTNGVLYRYATQAGNLVYSKADIYPTSIITPSMRWAPGY